MEPKYFILRCKCSIIEVDRTVSAYDEVLVKYRWIHVMQYVLSWGISVLLSPS